MAWPAVTQTATFDKTAYTFARSIDQKLWAALMAKHPILDMLQRPSVDERKFEWETDVAPQRTIIATTGTNLNGSATNASIGVANATSDPYLGSNFLELGMIIKNATRATPIGTYLSDEIMEITAISGASPAIVTVARNSGLPTGSSASNGSTVHGNTDVFEILYNPKQEGSAIGANRYADVALVANYTNTIDFALQVTGDQLHSTRIVAGDTLANQTAKNVLNTSNDMERMFFYGVSNQGAAAGSQSYVERTSGLDQFITASGGNVDYTTLDVTADAIDKLVETILENKTDPTDNFIIACHPFNARKISHFGSDKVIIDQTVTKYGRTIDTYLSDLGVSLPVIWTLNVSKSDLFIIDMDKVALPVFRPWEVAEVTYNIDATDAWRQRYLTSVGVKVVNPIYSFGKLSSLPWS